MFRKKQKPLSSLVNADLVEDIRLRILYAPEIVGIGGLTLPPVDWERVEVERKAEDKWQQQFEK